METERDPEAPTTRPAGLISAQKAAGILDLSADRVRELARSGDLPAVRIGSVLRFVPSEVERFASERAGRGSRRYPWKDGTLGLEEAADRLGISRWTLAKLADEGKISSVLRHGQRRFLDADLEAFVEESRLR